MQLIILVKVSAHQTANNYSALDQKSKINLPALRKSTTKGKLGGFARSFNKLVVPSGLFAIPQHDTSRQNKITINIFCLVGPIIRVLAWNWLSD